mmetsp:Transcript_3630/g.6386  ORF Transcript_3630/g.6386 Transcript_3630/m.6386 type:complete len:357 (+) Transcript_3630:2260-3330(+)
MACQLNCIQPGLVVHPSEGTWTFVVLVQRRPCFQEDQDVITRHDSTYNIDLQCDHELEHHLVSLEEATVHVPVGLVGEEVDDFVHPFRRRLYFFRIPDRIIELLQELVKGAVVHPTAWLQGDGIAHHDHVCHVEVHDTSARCHGSELLPLFIDLHSPLTCLFEFAFNLLCLCLCVRQDFDKLRVIQEVSFGVGKPIQKLFAKRLQGFGVVGGLFLQSCQHFLQCALLHVKNSSEQLLLQTSERDREVDHRCLCRELGAKVWIWQPRRHVQAELIVKVDDCIPNFDDKLLGPLLYNCFLENRVQHWIHLVLHILDDEAQTLTHRALNLLLEHLVAESRDAHGGLVANTFSFLALDPD